MPTPRAILRRIRGVHSEQTPTGPCCLVGEIRCKLGPRRVRDALGETLVGHHPSDRKVFDGDQVKLVDEAATVRVGTVAPPPGDAFVDAGHDVAPRSTSSGALLGLGEPSLGAAQRPFVLAEEAGGLNRVLRAGSERGKGLEANINADGLPSGQQRRCLSALAREGDVPLPRAAATKRRRLGRAFQRTMQDELLAPLSPPAAKKE